MSAKLLLWFCRCGGASRWHELRASRKGTEREHTEAARGRADRQKDRKVERPHERRIIPRQQAHPRTWALRGARQAGWARGRGVDAHARQGGEAEHTAFLGGAGRARVNLVPVGAIAAGAQRAARVLRVHAPRRERQECEQGHRGPHGRVRRHARRPTRERCRAKPRQRVRARRAQQINTRVEGPQTTNTRTKDTHSHARTHSVTHANTHAHTHTHTHTHTHEHSTPAPRHTQSRARLFRQSKSKRNAPRTGQAAPRARTGNRSPRKRATT
jgi:hypothetical protein